MGEVLSNKEYLNGCMDSIKSSINESVNLEIKNNNYGSTTKVPSKEPMLIEQLLTASKEIFTKLSKDIDNIKSVGENFKTMDNFLKDQNIDLGFQVTSFNTTVAELSEFATTSLEDLLKETVPIIPGYNDEAEDPGTGSHGGPSGPGGGDEGTPSTPTPKTEAPTSAPTSPKTEAPTEKPTTAPTDPKTETPTEKPTSVQTEVPTVAPTEVPTVAPSTEAPTSGGGSHGGGGGTNHKPPKPGVETKTTPVEVPTIVEEPEIIPDEPAIIEDPIIEEPVEEEPIIDVPETDYYDEEVIAIDDGIDTSTTTHKSRSGKVAGGVITGLGLAAGAAAVGYGMYKKSKDDKEYEDYGYEDDGGDIQ